MFRRNGDHPFVNTRARSCVSTQPVEGTQLIMIAVEGTQLPLNMPISSFEPSELPQLSPQLLENLRALGHKTPTPLQRHVVPVALAGRDLTVVGATRESQATSLLLPVVSALAIDPRALPAKSGGLCLLYTSPSPRDRQKSRMPSSA